VIYFGAILAFLLSLKSGLAGAEDSCSALIPTKCPELATRHDDGTSRTWTELEAKAPQLIKQVRNDLIAFIDENITDPKHRQSMRDRIENLKVNIDWRGGAPLEGLYDPSTNSTQLHKGSFKIPSDFAFIQILAHEMAHAIDPCNLLHSLGEKGKFPPIIKGAPIPLKPETLPSGQRFLVPDYSNYSLTAFVATLPLPDTHRCLLDPTAGGLSNLEELMKKEMSVTVLNERDRGVREQMIQPICLFSRHGETFCDFLAAEMLGRFIKKNKLQRDHARAGLKNTITALCDPKNFQESPDSGLWRHPSAKVRVEKILLANPNIRAAACPEDKTAVRYCGSSPVTPANQKDQQSTMR
jgi:hypothetical protein